MSRVAPRYIATSHITRGGKTYTRHLLRASYRAHGTVLHRPLAHVSPCAAAEIEALRHKEALEHLGTIQDALTLKHGMAFAAVWTGYPIARRLGRDKALGTTRAGPRALWHVLARVLAQGSRLSAVRLARPHAAGAVLGGGPVDAEALYEPLAGLAGAPAAVADRLSAQRTKRQPVPWLLYDVTRSSLAGAQNDLAACGDNRDGKTGTRQLGIG
jgi:hypothetical protein